MTDPRRSISDAAIERALAYRAPHGADDRWLASIVADAVRVPQQRRWTAGLQWLGSGSRPLVFAALTLTMALTIGALLLGGSDLRPSPSVAPDPLLAGNGPITLSGYIPSGAAPTTAVVGMPTCSTCPAGTQPAWSRDGASLAYIVNGDELWTWHQGDARARQLVACHGSDCEPRMPSWSPDGRSILFVANGRLSIIDVTTLEVRHVPGPIPSQLVAGASWSATDRIAVLTSDLRTQKWSAWISASDGSDPVLVASSTPASGQPDIAISPDGGRVVLLEDDATPETSDGSTIRVWVHSVDGAPGRLLYERPGCCLGFAGFSTPAWSPDGTKIAFVGLTNVVDSPIVGDVALLAIDASTSDRTIVVPVPSRPGPTWSGASWDRSAPAWRPIPANASPAAP